MSGIKRPAADQDPDYEEIRPQQQEKRQRLYEEGAKEETVRKIEDIIRRQFAEEIQNKEAEIMLIDERLNQARLMADRLRACIVANFYSRAGLPLAQSKSSQSHSAVHPAVKKYLGKAPSQTSLGNAVASSTKTETNSSKQPPAQHSKMDVGNVPKRPTIEIKQEPGVPKETQKKTEDQGHYSRFKVKRRIIVGNVSKYIPVDRREDNDRSTHRWMVYVRGPENSPNIDEFVDKVWFFLHPSYKPHDLVEISERPFHLTRRGWGEFPVRVQLHFKDTRNKRVDIIHNLKLDRTYTGLQTLGSETVVDIELERDSIGLPKPPVIAPTSTVSAPTQTLKAKQTSQTGKNIQPVTTASEPLGNVKSIVPANGESKIPQTTKVVIKQEKIDLSIVKTEPLDAAEAEMAALGASRGEGNTAMSPPRPGTVTPVKMVFGALGTSPARITSPASVPTTPVKEGSGWTRIQIKSEPSSPRASPVNKKGWQNISMLTSPIKSEPGSDTGGNTSEGGQMVTSSPTKLILTPGGGIAQLAQGSTKTASQGQKIAVVAAPAAATASSQPITIVSQSPSSILRAPGTPVVPGQVQVRNISPATGTVFSTAGKQQQQQPTVYIRCRDNSGKVYLIPQHVLNKTTTNVASPPQPKSTQIQRVSTPMGMAILSPGGTLPVQTGNQGNIAMGTVQALASLAASQQRTSGSPASTATTVTPKVPAMTTTIQNAGKTATLTYVLATTGGTSTTPTLTSVSQGQKVITAIQGQGQNLVLASAVNQGQGQSLILSTGQKSSGGTPLTLLGAKSVVSKPATPLSSGATGNDARRSLLVSPPLNDNLRIVGGNIVSGPQKGASNIVLINQQPIAGQTLTTTNQPAGKTAGTGGVSLLTGLGGIRTSTTRPKAGVIAQATPRLPTSGVSLLTKVSPAGVRQVSPGTVIIKQEPKTQQLAVRPLGATLVSAQRAPQPQLVLVTAAPPTGSTPPTVVMATGKKPQQVSAQSSLLSSVGNHKVFVQLMPQQPVASTMRNTGHKPHSTGAAVKVTSSAHCVSSVRTVGGVGSGDVSKVQNSYFHKVQPKKNPVMEKPIELSRYQSLEELIRAVVRWHPVTKEGVDRSIHPYCAETEEEFFSWRLGKRRAAEWCRAAAVQRRIRSALTENVQDGGGGVGCQDDSVRFHGDPLWSKKRIVWWCRHHAYTPWDQDLLRHVKKKTIIDNDSNRPIHQGEISTLSDAGPLVERLTEQLTRQREESGNQESDDDDIDIISCDMVHRVRVKKEVQTAPDTSLTPEVLPPSQTAHFVHEVAAQIGVHMRPVEVDHDTAPGVHVHVVEDMIMAVTRMLMGDIVRKAKALLSEKLKPCEELTTHHISAALNSIPICDIITNSGLGVLSENGTAEEITPTTHPPA